MTTIDAQHAFPMSQQLAAHTRSQLDVMKLLVRFPLLSVAELAFALGHSVAWTYAQMRALRAAGLVEPTSAPVGGPMCATYPRRNMEGQMATATVSAATLKGLEWLEAASGSAVWRLATQTGADTVGLTRLRRRLPAVLAVQSFVFALLRQIQQGTVALPRTDSKAERSRFPAQLMWDWVRDPVLHYHWRARPMTVHVDAAVQLRVRLEMGKQDEEESLHRAVPGAEYALAVLYDGGLAEARDLRRMLLQFMQCREALAEEGRGRCLPPLLILTPDARRAVLWQALALQLTTERWLTHPLIGGAVVWAAENGAGSCDSRDTFDAPDHIWRDHTWRSLAQPVACDLASLITTGATSIDPPSWSTIIERVTSSTVQRVQRSDNRRQALEKAAHREALGATDIAARNLSVLQLLYVHPLLSAEELAAALSVETASSERYLRHLREARLVTQRQFALSEPALMLGGKTPAPIQQRYALSAQGFAVVTMCVQGPGWRRIVRTVGDLRASATQRLNLGRDIRYQRYQRDMQLLARTPDHTAGVYGFFALLHATARTACRSGYLHALVWWETGRACMRRYREGSGWHAIWPDGAGEYRADGHRMRFWLEWDRGTMGRRDLIAKFAAYARYLRSREWRVDGNEPVPELLIVTSDVAQQTRVTAALSATFRYAPGLSVSVTSRAALAAQGPLAPIWRRAQYNTSLGRVVLDLPCPLIGSR